MESRAAGPKSEIFSKGFLITVLAVVALAMVQRYVVGALLWLNGFFGAYAVSLVAVILSLAFLSFQFLTLRKRVAEIRARRRSGQPTDSYKSKAAFLLVAAGYCLMASSITLAVELVAKPNPHQREQMVVRIFATPPWNGSFIKS